MWSFGRTLLSKVVKSTLTFQPTFSQFCEALTRALPVPTDSLFRGNPTHNTSFLIVRLFHMTRLGPTRLIPFTWPSCETTKHIPSSKLEQNRKADL